jgi:tetratricopeptide (TPR) repeat protein
LVFLFHLNLPLLILFILIIGLFDKCIEDAGYAIELSPQTSKYYWRKGVAHLALGQLYAAKLAFQNGLKKDPGNDQIRNALNERKA